MTVASSSFHHRSRPRLRTAVVAGYVFTALAVGALDASAQARLTLAEALQRAARQNESIDIARAGEARADAEQLRVQSQRRPQLSFLGTYSRTLASEFSGAFESSGPACARWRAGPARLPA